MKTGLLISWAVFLCSPRALSVRDDKTDHFVGWKGETFDEKVAFKDTLYQVPPRSSITLASAPEQVAQTPLAYVWRNFLSRDEAKHIVTLAAPRMLRSQIGGGETVDSVRTSYGAFLHRHQDDIVSAVQHRVAAWLQLPVSYQEDTQILRYSPGQVYKPHMDANGRMCTVLVYLTDVQQGGETAFPTTTSADWLTPGLAPPANASVSDCARGHVHAAPRRGDALLFYSLPPGTETLDAAAQNASVPDRASMHTGCPPAEGNLKWTATFWVHFKPFRPESYTTAPQAPLPDPGECANYNSHCEGWAKAGECDRNPGFMQGGKGSAGQCRFACGLCTPCALGNRTCLEAAREAQGFLPDLTNELRTLFEDQ